MVLHMVKRHNGSLWHSSIKKLLQFLEDYIILNVPYFFITFIIIIICCCVYLFFLLHHSIADVKNTSSKRRCKEVQKQVHIWGSRRHVKSQHIPCYFFQRSVRFMLVSVKTVFLRSSCYSNHALFWRHSFFNRRYFC